MEKRGELPVKDRRKRVFFLVLPLLVIPFLVLAFKAMGGGQPGNRQLVDAQGGLNADLPEVNAPKGKSKGMLGYYEQAREDSIKRLQAMLKDPYLAQGMDNGDEFGAESGLLPFMPMEDSSYGQQEKADEQAQRVYQRLDELTQAMEQSNHPAPSGRPENLLTEDPEVVALRRDIVHLEQLMESMQSRHAAPDPEMEQINGVLQQVLDIQHPDRVRERMQHQSLQIRGKVFAVAPAVPNLPVTVLVPPNAAAYGTPDSASPRSNAFYGLESVTEKTASDAAAIGAVIHETQVLVSGATVKLRQLQDTYINGTLIPAGSFIYGIASLQGERLEIDIPNIRCQDMVFPVKLSVYDLDGLPGIHIPGAISRDVMKQQGDQVIQDMNLGMFNPSLGMQAASAGIEVGKNLLGRKIRLTKVEVKAGHRVLLRDANNKN